MKRDFTIERQGRTFVLYAGLLDEAHQQGLKSIRTHLLQIPSPENGNVAICFAEIQTDRGTFTGIGDAAPDNVARAMVPHLIRMAETRSKARAIRDSINVGAVAVEELADTDELGSVSPEDEQPEQPARLPTPDGGPINIGLFANGAARTRTMPIRPAAPPVTIGSRDGSKPAIADRGGLATPAQVRAIYLIGRDQHGLSEAAIDERSVGLFGSAPAELTKKQASELITSLKASGQAASAR